MSDKTEMSDAQKVVADTPDDHTGEPVAFCTLSDDPVERLKETIAFWDKGEMDYPAELNSTLEKEFDRLTHNRKNLKVLVTLCGKTEDLKWLSDRGHDVVGVDIAEKAAIDFFEMYKLEHTVNDVPSIDGKVYMSMSGKLKFYVGNFFLFDPNLEGLFDVIWDAAGFVSLDRRDWDKFLAAWRKLLSPDCVFLFEVMEYNTKKFTGPPYSVGLDEIKEIFGAEFPTVDLVEERENEHDADFPFKFYCLRRK